MRLSTILSIAFLSATTLVATDLQQIADNLQVKAPTASSKKLAIP